MTNLNDIITVIQKVVVNEYIPIKTISLVTIGGRKCINKHPLSTNIMINDDGGIGKDFLVSSCMRVIDKDNWLFQKSPTPAAITLSQRSNDGIVQKPINKETIIYIEDATPRFTDDNPHLKLLLDNDVINYPVVDKMHTFLVSWNKPVVIITCAETFSNKQLSRRLPQLSLNSSKDQTKDICLRKRLIETGKYNNDITDIELKKINTFIKSLKSYNVILSDDAADAVFNDFLNNNYDKMFIRTVENRIYDYIKFSAIIHQDNRDKKDDNTLIATIDDYNNIKDIIQFMYNIYADNTGELSQFNQRQKNIINLLKNNPSKLYTTKTIFHSNCSGDVSLQTIYSDMRKLVREHKNIDMLESPVKSMPSTYYWSNKK